CRTAPSTRRWSCRRRYGAAACCERKKQPRVPTARRSSPRRARFERLDRSSSASQSCLCPTEFFTLRSLRLMLVGRLYGAWITRRADAQGERRSRRPSGDKKQPRCGERAEERADRERAIDADDRRRAADQKAAQRPKSPVHEEEAEHAPEQMPRGVGLDRRVRRRAERDEEKSRQRQHGEGKGERMREGEEPEHEPEAERAGADPQEARTHHAERGERQRGEGRADARRGDEHAEARGADVQNVG